jgi:hypothetical protein
VIATAAPPGCEQSVAAADCDGGLSNAMLVNATSCWWDIRRKVRSVAAEKQRRDGGRDRRCRRPGFPNSKGMERHVEPGDAHEQDGSNGQELTNAHNSFPDELPCTDADSITSQSHQSPSSSLLALFRRHRSVNNARNAANSCNMYTSMVMPAEKLEREQ